MRPRPLFYGRILAFVALGFGLWNLATDNKLAGAFLIGILFALTTLLLWLARTKGVPFGDGYISRQEAPKWFWTQVSLFAVGWVMMLTLLVGYTYLHFVR